MAFPFFFGNNKIMSLLCCVRKMQKKNRWWVSKQFRRIRRHWDNVIFPQTNVYILSCEINLANSSNILSSCDLCPRAARKQTQFIPEYIFFRNNIVGMSIENIKMLRPTSTIILFIVCVCVCVWCVFHFPFRMFCFSSLNIPMINVRQYFTFHFNLALSVKFKWELSTLLPKKSVSLV